jgi:CMP-N,N'-diacetyllegionaminic acid synthase
MEILFTICGRAGSKGIKNKNLKNFSGFPLPFYSLSVINLYTGKNPDLKFDIVLNTDSRELTQLITDNVTMDIHTIDRDKSLGGDYIPKIAVIKNSYQIMQEKKNKQYVMVVDLDITSPLRTAEDLGNLICKKRKSDADVVFSVTEARRNPYFNMVKKSKKGYVRVIDSSFNARQQAPEIFDMNASLYAYSPEFLESGKGIFEGKCDIIKMADTGILDIDSENDFELMEIISEYLYKNNSSMSEVRQNINRIIR